jgi:hypothetical protein
MAIDPAVVRQYLAAKSVVAELQSRYTRRPVHGREPAAPNGLMRWNQRLRFTRALPMRLSLSTVWREEPCL